MFSQYVLFLLFPPLARPCTATREKLMIMITSKELVITDFNTHLLAHSAVTNLNTEHPPAEAASRQPSFGHITSHGGEEVKFK